MTNSLKPELLAPAGDFDALRAACANGADAVYFGLSDFNARHRAANFPPEELPHVMKYLRDHNVRGYVTLNTLIFSDELPQAMRLVRACVEAGVDAVIVQDLGLAQLMSRAAPGLEIHGSTQMTLSEARGIEFVRGLGVKRVILARELSRDDIQRIAPVASIPVEVFVHGALCVAYSGQCLTSESLGGRSANRGQCAQACRLPYDLIVDGQQRDLGDKAYLLSPQDLAAYDLIGDLVKLGVRSFKIEGRLKSAHYVAATTQTYRAALDAAIAGAKYDITRQQFLDLSQSFSRGFTHGFLDGVNHQELVHARFPKSRGVRIGEVAAKSSRGLIVALERDRQPADLKPGDGVVFDEGHPEQDEQGGRLQAVNMMKDRRLELVFFDGDVQLPAVQIGSIVWKTDDPQVRKRLAQSFAREGVARRIKLHARVFAQVGEKLRIELRDEHGHEAIVESDSPMQRAEKFPLTVELLREQLGRLGNTPYELGDLRLARVDVAQAPRPCSSDATEGTGEAPVPQPGGADILVCHGAGERGIFLSPRDCANSVAVMVPKSVLNDLRRRAIDELLRQREAHDITFNDAALDQLRLNLPSPQPPPQAPTMTVLVRTLDQLRAVCDLSARPERVYCDFEDVRRYKEAVAVARAAQMPIALATLRIIKPHEEGLLRQIADCGPDGVLARNLAAISFYCEQFPALALFGDYSLNVANELAAGIFLRAGLRSLVPSYDLNWQQMQAMLRHCDPGIFEVVIHQHMPMFHMEHCVFAHTLSNGKDYRDCGRPCETHQVDLRDRVGASHPLIPDVGCRNTLYNATAQSAAEYVPQMKELGLRYFRVELLRQGANDAIELLDRYARVLAGVEDGKRAVRQLRVLNQLGVTRGTLQHG